MNDRAQAIEILKQAREILLSRLSEQILEVQEEILDDAQGHSYMGEIDVLHERIGGRLMHVNQMLSNLPPVPDDVPTELGSSVSSEDAYQGETTVFEAVAGSYEAEVEETSALPNLPAALALPAPEVSSAESAPVQTASFVTFMTWIQAGDVDAAGRQLAILFEISEVRGCQCAQVFSDKMHQDRQFMFKAMQLRKELQSSGNNGTLMILQNCFGLEAIESIGVLQVLKTKLKTLT